MARSNVVSGSIRATTLFVLLTIGAAGCSDSPIAPEEVTAIGWGATARQVEGEVNDRHVFVCVAGGTPATVWGDGVYTDDSSICTAGVHAGVITLAAGGRVTIELRPGQDTYTAATRNGITTRLYTEWPRSFVVH
jgi:hypothetical protein